MRFTQIATLISCLGTAAASAIPQPAAAGAVPESISKATAVGIDVYGPIPNDYLRKEDGLYVAAEGSKAWEWIRAQIDIDWTKAPALEKRQGAANIGIGMWAQDGCRGEGYWVDNVSYNTNTYAGVNLFSVGISYRGLRDNEQLDFSRLQGGDACGKYLYSAGRNTPTGCFNSQAINCFRLWLR